MPRKRSEGKRWPKGLRVNETIPEPSPPGPWVDGEICDACGESYDDFRSTLPACPQERWRLGLEDIKVANSGVAFKSLGPVLWALRVRKLGEWYERHALCGAEDEEPSGDFDETW